MSMDSIHRLQLHPDTFFEGCSSREDLAYKSVRGGMATMAAQVAQFALSAGGMIVLARLLTPDDYGLVGMVMVVVGFAAMFKDAGLSMATVQRAYISAEQVSTLFWINVLISVVLAACVLLSAPLVAAFYGRPELTSVTAALSMSFIISGVTIQHQALLRRRMRFGALAAIQVVSQALSVGVSIAAALLGWRYWALVAGSLAAALVGTPLTFYFCPWWPGRPQRRAGVRGMLAFGGHLTGFNVVNYFARNMDNVLIGRFVGAEALGLYAKAYNLFLLPINQIRGPITEVAMPALSSLHAEPARYAKYYQRLLDLTASLTVPVTLCCIIEGDFIIRSLLGQQWIGAVGVFRILAVAGLLQPALGTVGVVMLSCGYAGRQLRIGLLNSVVTVLAFVAGLPFGIEGVAIAYAIASYVLVAPTLLYSFKMTPIRISLFSRSLYPSFSIGALAAMSALLVRLAGAEGSSGYHVVSLGVFAGVYVVLSLCRSTIRETARLLCNDLWIRLRGAFS